MEHMKALILPLCQKGLNPCFNGIQMERNSVEISTERYCLNPCFNGIQMERYQVTNAQSYEKVLILVLMEYKWNGAVACSTACSQKS